MTKKSALITGICGQDGSYLAELLLEKDYNVYGFKRRTSGNDLGCSAHLEGDIEIIEGDLTDLPSLQSAVQSAKPHEFYNLAAQSHVGTSFKQPVYTTQATGLGVLNCLEAVRSSGYYTKFYQASTSELFGGVHGKTLMTEESPFHPRSPYGVAKLYGHWATVNYRESYNMFASTGLLFNHETVTYSTPMIIKTGDEEIDILPIGEIARLRSGVIFDLTKEEYQEGAPVGDLQVWDQGGWTKVKWVSGYPSSLRPEEDIKHVNARSYLFSATDNHVAILEEEEKPVCELRVGDKIQNIYYPEISGCKDISEEEAEFLGMLVGDGNLSKNNPRFTNKSTSLKERFKTLWTQFTNQAEFTEIESYSGFTGEKVGQIICNNKEGRNFDIYCNDESVFGHKYKKVPKVILNASPVIQVAFLRGYNACDGLKANPCTYEFKNFKTNSPTLAAGLLFLVSKTTEQEWNITIEESSRHGKVQYYYSLNLLSPRKTQQKYQEVSHLLKKGLSNRRISRELQVSRSFVKKVKEGYIPDSHHLRKVSNEIKKIIPNQHKTWLFDLETESGTFHAGIGNGVIHNSPRRGPNFVTRKITLGVAAIKAGKMNKLGLGNLDSYRDWGHAKDYVRGMWMMLQAPNPGDYILASGETSSVRDFCRLAFEHVGLHYQDHVYVDPQFFRPAEVDVLIGDASKAKRELGWEPEYSFADLVKEMVESDVSKLSNSN